jgi:antitoxin component YwqK of YwqJK toxin-antitoxin module
MFRKYTKLALIAVFFASFLFSCKKADKTFYDTGELHELIGVNSNGERHGSYKRYDIDGSLQEEASYVEGKQQGLKKIYTDEGILESTSTYKDGVMEGPYQVFFPSGKLKIDAAYRNNAINGIFKKFYENGGLKEVVTFVDGEENGSFEEYHPNGQIEWKGTYRKGDHEYGLLERFDDKGQLLKKMMFDSTFIGKTIWKKEGYNEPQN